MAKRWTQEDINILNANINAIGFTRGIDISCRALGRTRQAVYFKARELGHKGDQGYLDNEIEYFETLLAENPGNITKACELFAEKVGKSPRTIINAYYDPKSRLYRGKLSTCFVVVGKESIINGKVKTPKSKTVNAPKIWQRVLNMFKIWR